MSVLLHNINTSCTFNAPKAMDSMERLSIRLRSTIILLSAHVYNMYLRLRVSCPFRLYRISRFRAADGYYNFFSPLFPEWVTCENHQKTRQRNNTMQNNVLRKAYNDFYNKIPFENASFFFILLICISISL